jgi:glucose-6-phosphate-specific signal transduction histidine kinase
MHEFGVLCSHTLPTLEERLLSDASRNPIEVSACLPGVVGLVVDDRIDWQQLDELAPWIVPKFRLVIEECMINARRHGQGSEMTIHVVEGPQRLTLHCEDNGFGVDAQAPKGLGSRLFDEICADHLGGWSLQRSGDRTMFVLSVQLAP